MFERVTHWARHCADRLRRLRERQAESEAVTQQQRTATEQLCEEFERFEDTLLRATHDNRYRIQSIFDANRSERRREAGAERVPAGQEAGRHGRLERPPR